MLCHLPLIMPFAGLVLFAVLPWPEALALYVPLTGVSLAIAIPAIRAMYLPPRTGAEGMHGKRGVVVTADGCSGLVSCDGELWQYAAPEPLAPGDRVRIETIEPRSAIARVRALEPAIGGTSR